MSASLLLRKEPLQAEGAKTRRGTSECCSLEIDASKALRFRRRNAGRHSKKAPRRKLNDVIQCLGLCIYDLSTQRRQALLHPSSSANTSKVDLSQAPLQMEDVRSWIHGHRNHRFTHRLLPHFLLLLEYAAGCVRDL